MVKGFSRETWSYAVLLVILCAIASIAVVQTIDYLQVRVPDYEIKTVTIMLWTLTMGFMLIAGAFGLWSVQFAAGAESRRRISAIVSSMDYIRDGLLAVDHHDRVIGCNPAGETMLHDTAQRKRPLVELFPSLQEEDLQLLLHDRVPQEVERSHIDASLTHTLRFRSQPSRGVTLLLISDVTSARARRQHRQQAARLQLVGQLARAVANDFNNLLCGIAGYAALLPRLPAGAPEMADSIQAIAESSERGIELAGHLMDLSRPDGNAIPTRMVGDHVTNAANALRDALPTGWTVETRITETPATSLTGMQIEQVVLSLGQIIAGEADNAGSITIVLGPAGAHPLLNVAERFCGGILLAGAEVGSAELHAHSVENSNEAGLLISVIHSILEGAGGELQQMTGADGRPIFRIALPVATAFDNPDEQVELPFDIDHYLANWRVLIAGRKHRHLNLVNRLQKLNVVVNLVESITAILAATEQDAKLDAVIIDWPLLGAEEEGALRALAKLSPGSGIVVLRDAARARQQSIPGVVYVPSHARVEAILMAMVEARSLGAARGRAVRA